jgi:Ca2+-binding EF-hand superfamily protein
MLRELCDDFQKVDIFCKQNNVQISDVQIDTFMKILDDDQNGMLEYEEVVDVLEGKKNIGLGKEEKFKQEMLEQLDKYYRKFLKIVGWA